MNIVWSSRPDAPGSVQNSTERSNSQAFRSSRGLALVDSAELCLIVTLQWDTDQHSDVTASGRMTRRLTTEAVVDEITGKYSGHWLSVAAGRSKRSG